jgi:hypothetical protein
VVERLREHDHGRGIAVALGLAALCPWIASRVFVRENA